MTATVSHISATTPRSCVIRMMAMPSCSCSCAQQVQDLRLGGDVQRRGRLVGDQDARAAGQGHGDHGPLAQAAGELEGVLVDAPLRLGDAHQARGSSMARSRASALLDWLSAGGSSR